jgi:hypothetical protein
MNENLNLRSASFPIFGLAVRPDLRLRRGRGCSAIGCRAILGVNPVVWIPPASAAVNGRAFEGATRRDAFKRAWNV